MSRIIGTLAAILVLYGPPAWAQPVDKSRMEMYFGAWSTATPRSTRGGLEQRDILTRGDPLNPVRKSAVLKYVNSFTYATLAPGASTSPIRLRGEQEIYFVARGRGSMKAGGDSAELYRNVAVLVPADLEFIVQNTAAEPLGMYLINEPAPPGFRPNNKLLVRNENALPITSTDGHWSHIVKTLFTTADGLGTLESVLTVSQDALTIGHPHVAHVGSEEVWTALEGTSIAFLDEALLRHPPGTAFLVRPDDMTPHADINYMEEGMVKWLFFARIRDHELRR